MQILVYPYLGGSPAWEDGPNRSFSLSLPPPETIDGIKAADLSGGFIITMHPNFPHLAAEPVFFQVLPSPQSPHSSSQGDRSDQAMGTAVPSQAIEGPSGRLPANIDPVPLCHFTVPHKVLKSGESLVLCGDIPELGSWDPNNGLELLQRQPGDNWVGKIRLPITASFQAKVSFIIIHQCHAIKL